LDWIHGRAGTELIRSITDTLAGTVQASSSGPSAPTRQSAIPEATTGLGHHGVHVIPEWPGEVKSEPVRARLILTNRWTVCNISTGAGLTIHQSLNTLMNLD
jgi:hypothetical protein